MSEIIRCGHSFNAGDLITCLPGVQYIYRETGKKVTIYQRLDLPADYSHNVNHPIKSDVGVQVCMNRKTFELMKPLIESQEYVESFNIWKGEEVDFNMDLTRLHTQVPLPGGSIHHWPTLIFPQLECDLSIQWLNADKIYKALGIAGFIDGKEHEPYYADKIIINRTARYNNPYITYFFLKKYESNIIFAGLPQEHESFCAQWELNIPILEIHNFLHLAQSILSCMFFVGCQSMCWHIADAMKHPRILEVCTAYPNTFPTGANGHSFISQNALEYKFAKLFNETK